MPKTMLPKKGKKPKKAVDRNIRTADNKPVTEKIGEKAEDAKDYANEKGREAKNFVDKKEKEARIEVEKKKPEKQTK